MHTTPANVRDEQPLLEMIGHLPAIQGPRGRPRQKPGAVVGDRGYGFAHIINAIIALKILSMLAPRGSDHGSGMGKIRYVIERTFVWFGHWRRLKICYEKRAEHWQAFNELVAAMICFRKLRRIQTGL